MTDAEYIETMSSLQLSGHRVKWYVHAKGHFNKRRGFDSQSVAEHHATEGLVVTPDFY